MNNDIKITLIICITIATIALGGFVAFLADDYIFAKNNYCEKQALGKSDNFWIKCDDKSSK